MNEIDANPDNANGNGERKPKESGVFSKIEFI
jgi:hypothetical protein